MKIKIRLGNRRKINPKERESLLVVRDYARSYSKVLMDPADKAAEEVMNRCENIIMLDPNIHELIGDPLDFLYGLDLQIETEHERRMRCRR